MQAENLLLAILSAERKMNEISVLSSTCIYLSVFLLFSSIQPTNKQTNRQPIFKMVRNITTLLFILHNIINITILTTEFHDFRCGPYTHLTLRAAQGGVQTGLREVEVEAEVGVEEDGEMSKLK